MHFECDILNSNLKQTITQCGATQDFAISSDGMAFSFKGHLHSTWTDFDSLWLSLFLTRLKRWLLMRFEIQDQVHFPPVF